MPVVSGNSITTAFKLLFSGNNSTFRRVAGLATGKGRNSKRNQQELSFHCLGHTTTRLMKNAGVRNAVAMDIIGHESEAISKNYPHIDTETKRDAPPKAMKKVLA